MSQRKHQIGQLLWIGFAGLEANDSLRQRIRAQEMGAVVLFRRNIDTLQQVAELNRSLHEAAPTDCPLLISLDQEGGRVQRVKAPATEWPPMLRLGELWQREPKAATVLARQVGNVLGQELFALGFDLDFAPVLDVHTNAQNPVIGDRAFCTTPEGVIELAGAFADGLHSAGVLSCGKHFPGHGDTMHDSHLLLPRIDHDVDRLYSVELRPFARLTHLPVFMTAHVIFTALDSERPATMSKRVLTDVLRGEIGYEGVVVSDDMEMKAIADNYGIAEAMEQSLLAGCDAFLLCEQESLQHAATEALHHAAERSSEVRDRLAQAAARVLALKRAHSAKQPRALPMDLIGSDTHRLIADRMHGPERPD